MKKNIYFLVAALITTINAMGWGSDTKPKPDPTVDQTNVQLAIAFNGWVYEAFSTYDATTDAGGVTIRCSKSNGEFWENVDSYATAGYRYNSFDIAVAGTSIADLKLFVVGVAYQTSSSSSLIYVDKYDATTYSFIGPAYNTGLTTDYYRNVAITTDYENPSFNSSPYALGIVYSKYGAPLDSVACFVSTDAGTTFSYLPVGATSGYTRGVSIAYGKGANYSNGRLFVAYEDRNSSAARDGHIYYSHTDTYVNDFFSLPFCLDSLNSGMINFCSNPQIAVQYNYIDNDSGACTAVVIMDRDYTGTGLDNDILGFYNKTAPYSNNWTRFDLANTLNNEFHGDLEFDPYFNNFIATYVDSTNGLIPYVINAMNMTTPDAWSVVSTNYSDYSTGLFQPHPTVVMNSAIGNAAFGWSRLETNETAYFDAEYSTVVPYTQSINDAFCTGSNFVYNGITYTMGGVYPFPATASNGLDSTTTLTLTENPLPTPTITPAGNILSTQLFVTYQWNLSGSAIIGANSQSYTLMNDGSYTVTVTDANGCTNESAAYLFTNVNDLANAGISYYPNPTTDRLTIDVAKFSSDLVNVKIINNVGQIVHSEQISGMKTIGLENLSNGIYTLQMRSGNKTISGQLIKQ